MNAGATAERVYDALKRRILEREFRPGDRLDPAALSETLNSSVTPVRDCLHTLKGELLVETRASEGFYLPQVDAPGLQDLYVWNAQILGLVLKNWPSDMQDATFDRESASDPDVSADATAVFFARVAHRSSNIEHRRAIGSMNDRLHAARLAESRVITDINEELLAMQRTLAANLPRQLGRLLASYHRRRHRAAPEIVRTLYRNGTPR